MTQAATIAHTGTVIALFRGERDVVGPLTEGQRATLRWSRNMTEGSLHIMEFTVGLPRGTAVADVTAALGMLLTRHETLRTTYRLGRDPVQRVVRAGQLPVEVYEVRGDDQQDTDSDHWAAIADMLHRRLREQSLDAQRDLPLRVAVATRLDCVLLLVVRISHMAVDLSAWILLERELLRLLAEPAARTVGAPTLQPLEQAAVELSVPQRRLRAAQRYWEREFRRAPQVLYTVPANGRGRGPALRGMLSSAAARYAVAHIMARTGASLQMTVLAAIAAVLGRRTGQRLCPLQVHHHARLRQRLRDYIGTLVMDVPVVIDTAVPTFDVLVSQVGTATIAAAWHTFTAAERSAARRVGYERGVDFAQDCSFNNVTGIVHWTGQPMLPTGSPAEAVAALPRTTMHLSEYDNMPELMLFRLTEADEVLELWLLTGDSHRVPPAEIESILRAVERLLVVAASADADLDHLISVAGVQPIPRGPEWSYVDSCWIEPAEVQRLVDDALDVPAARTFVLPDQLGRSIVVAYLVPGARIRTPEQAHRACLAALPDRHTALAPGRYVFCERAPWDVTSLADWQQAQVLIAGPGRAPGWPR